MLASATHVLLPWSFTSLLVLPCTVWNAHISIIRQIMVVTVWCIMSIWALMHSNGNLDMLWRTSQPVCKSLGLFFSLPPQMSRSTAHATIHKQPHPQPLAVFQVPPRIGCMQADLHKLICTLPLCNNNCPSVRRPPLFDKANNLFRFDTIRLPLRSLVANSLRTLKGGKKLHYHIHIGTYVNIAKIGLPINSNTKPPGQVT